MGLDLLKVKEILTFIDRSGGVINNKELFGKFGGDTEAIRYFYTYLKMLKETKMIDSSSHTLGFEWASQAVFKMEDASLEITFVGRQVLEALSNPSLLASLTSAAKESGFTSLRSIPALAIQSIFEKM
tara:strand:- start:891 stop:1274 length:384 start_codon:yes stop_codon:yes gene_type:complete